MLQDPSPERRPAALIAEDRKRGGTAMSAIRQWALGVTTIGLSMGLAACGTTGSLAPGNTSASATQAPAAIASANAGSATYPANPAARQSPRAAKTTTPPVPPPPKTPKPLDTAVPRPPATTSSCHPRSDEGGCYEPGEFCRKSDHGVTGRAGDGKTITCRNSNGWHWEAA